MCGGRLDVRIAGRVTGEQDGAGRHGALLCPPRAFEQVVRTSARYFPLLLCAEEKQVLRDCRAKRSQRGK